MKFPIMSAAIAALVSSPLWAATVTVNVSGEPTTYTLNSMSVLSSGDITVNVTPTTSGGGGGAPTSYVLTTGVSPAASGTLLAGGSPIGSVAAYSPGTAVNLTAQPAAGYTFTGWAGACSGTASCAVTMNSNQSVTANFASTSNGGSSGNGASCGNDPNLTCVDTPLPGAVLSQASFRPNPAQIYAFRVVAPTSGSFSSSATATVMSSSFSAKRLVMSETPGDIDTKGKSPGCYVQGGEASKLRFVVNKPTTTYDPYIYCHLSSGKTYYINATSRKADDSGYSCTTTTNCGFYFSGR